MHTYPSFVDPTSRRDEIFAAPWLLRAKENMTVLLWFVSTYPQSRTSTAKRGARQNDHIGSTSLFFCAPHRKSLPKEGTQCTNCCTWLLVVLHYINDPQRWIYTSRQVETHALRVGGDHPR